MRQGEAVNGVLVAILGYVLAQFAVGAVVSRRMASEADYILVGRRLGVGLITFSVFATYFGAEAIVASGGAVYERGLTGALVDPSVTPGRSFLWVPFSRTRCGNADLLLLLTCSGSAIRPAWSGWWSSSWCLAL